LDLWPVGLMACWTYGLLDLWPGIHGNCYENQHMFKNQIRLRNSASKMLGLSDIDRFMEPIEISAVHKKIVLETTMPVSQVTSFYMNSAI